VGWLDYLKIRLSHPAGAWLSLAIMERNTNAKAFN
jgi:hypothetical protein